MCSEEIQIIVFISSQETNGKIRIIVSTYLQEKLVKFMLACQDEETGGFADRPGDMVGIDSCFPV
jgi:geranylgeranyl transferase type-2 subunit beta